MACMDQSKLQNRRPGPRCQRGSNYLMGVVGQTTTDLHVLPLCRVRGIVLQASQDRQRGVARRGVVIEGAYGR